MPALPENAGLEMT